MSVQHLGKCSNATSFPVFNRSEVGMTQHCMRSYTQLVIKTCHKRGVHAMGGMAAQIPIKGNIAANQVLPFSLLIQKRLSDYSQHTKQALHQMQLASWLSGTNIPWHDQPFAPAYRRDHVS